MVICIYPTTTTIFRLGVVKSMHPEVQKYSFDTILQKMVNTDIR